MHILALYMFKYIHVLPTYLHTSITNIFIFSGVIGPEYSSETEVVSSILGSQTTKDLMLQIGFSSTSTELNDRSKYPNFYRVAVEDMAQTMVRMDNIFLFLKITFSC